MVGTHRFSRYCMRYVMEIFFSKENFSVDYKTCWTNTRVNHNKFQVSRARFLLSIFVESENGPIEVTPGGIKKYYLK